MLKRRALLALASSRAPVLAAAACGDRAAADPTAADSGTDAKESAVAPPSAWTACG